MSRFPRVMSGERTGNPLEQGLDRLRERYLAQPKATRANGFEFAVERLIGTFCASGTTAVDVGANYGGHTFNLLRAVGPAGRVIAVEADPQIAEQLRSWERHHPNLTVVNAAVLDRAGEVTFRVAAEQKGYGSILVRPHVDVAVERLVTVPATTLDTLLATEAGSVAFIKVDVEGAELLVVAGAEQTLRERRPLIAIEIDWQAHSGTAAEREFFGRMESAGYEVRSLFGERMSSFGREDLMVLLVPPDRFDTIQLARVGREAFTEFMDTAPTWHLYGKFESA